MSTSKGLGSELAEVKNGELISYLPLRSLVVDFPRHGSRAGHPLSLLSFANGGIRGIGGGIVVRGSRYRADCRPHVSRHTQAILLKQFWHAPGVGERSEEHTSELQSRVD